MKVADRHTLATLCGAMGSLSVSSPCGVLRLMLSRDFSRVLYLRLLACESPHPPTSTPTMAPSRNRGWWRTYFYDHPGYISKTAESTDSSGKCKVYCILCFGARYLSEKAFDESMVVAGTWDAVHSRQAVEDMGA